MDVVISINSKIVIKMLWNLVYIITYAYMLIYVKILKSSDCLENLFVDT